MENVVRRELVAIKRKSGKMLSENYSKDKDGDVRKVDVEETLITCCNPYFSLFAPSSC